MGVYAPIASVYDDVLGLVTATSPVSSVFGRTGAVIAVSGDYTAAQVGAEPVTSRIPADITAASYTVLAADLGTGTTLHFAPSGGTSAIALPAAALYTGKSVRMVQESGVGTVDPDGAETIAGAATFTLNANDAYEIESDGVGWNVL